MGSTKIRRGYRIEEDLDQAFGDKVKNISKNNVHLYIKDKALIEVLKVNDTKFKTVSQSEKKKIKKDN